MTKMEEMYEGNFLDALDLPEGALVPVEVEAIADPGSEKDAAGKTIKNAIVSFKGKSKRLILNRTNYKNLKAMFGRRPNDWIGKQIKIQRRYLDAAHAFGVQNTMCIRIVPPVGTPILKSAAQYMGSPTPYGQDGKPAQPREQKPAQKPPPKPAPEPDAKPDEPSELDKWLRAVAMLQTLEACSVFQESTLGQCPEAIRPQVEQALVEHMKKVPESQTGESDGK